MSRAPLASLLLVALAACGGRPAEPAKSPATPRGAAGAAAGAKPPSVDPAGALPSLDALAARGPSVAPLMRVAARVADAKTKPALEPDRDTCVRAVVAATAPVKAFFADARGTVRGDAFEGAEGVVPPNGPACVKRGDVVRLVVEGDAAARAVVFAAP